MVSHEFFVSAIENVFAVFLLVIAYKIYKSDCHTMLKSKIFQMEISGGDNEESSQL